MTLQGFATFTRTAIPVSINSLTRTDVQLQVGTVAETVNVSAVAATLQTDKSDVHVEISSREVRDIPLTGSPTITRFRAKLDRRFSGGLL